MEERGIILCVIGLLLLFSWQAMYRAYKQEQHRVYVPTTGTIDRVVFSDGGFAMYFFEIGRSRMGLLLIFLNCGLCFFPIYGMMKKKEVL